ncbi:MAG: hypothetical protein RL846_41195 [Deltaproteobacteria bacterium]
MPTARPGIGYPGMRQPHAAPPMSPYGRVPHAPRHPAAVHAEIAARVGRGEHPAAASRNAYTGGGTVRRAPSVPNPPSRAPSGDLHARSRRLVSEFAGYLGADADVHIDLVPGGPKALAFRDAAGREHVVVDADVPDYALPGIVAHEMGHVLRFEQGTSAHGPAAELDATYIGGQLLRRGGYDLGDALRALGDGFNGSATHGSLEDQQRALIRGYYGR